MTLNRLDPNLLELVPSLALLARRGAIFDKHVYSPFGNTQLLPYLKQRQVDSLIVTGVETDVCVLSGVLHAVDEGFRVILVKDALGSSSDETHDALLRVYATRLSEQIELSDVDTVLSCWI